MASKYGKYILSEPHAPVPSMIPLPGMTTEEMEKFIAAASPTTIRVNSNLIDTVGLDFQFVWISKPSEPGGPSHPPHIHDVDEYLFLIGSNPEDILDFGGVEVELTLGAGDDMEVHTITHAAVVYIPKGLAHLPIVFKKVDKPFLFGHILVAPDYTETRL